MICHCPLGADCKGEYPALCEMFAPGFVRLPIHPSLLTDLLNSTPPPLFENFENEDHFIGRPNNLTRELVVACFNEDLSWTSEIPEDIHVTVYNKGHVPVASSVVIINEGREAGTYLHHIVRNFSSLANMTFFCQGKNHSDDICGRLKIDYQEPASLTAEYMPYFPSPEVKALDRVDYHEGLQSRYGCAAYHGDRQPVDNAAWLQSVWSHWFSCDPPEDWVFGYAAEWAVPKESILARPLSFWKYALEQVQSATTDSSLWDSDPATAWGLELIWLYLFSDPNTYPTKVS
ncbi:DUF3431 domain-containing protein [Tundrisphaera sp. TA3]|uniref:DUF3431 domain-containing protein n=1 Tax=Tundrisphaera sp. TA3 TaxID=3435775 RepID=UPI003EC03B98